MTVASLLLFTMASAGFIIFLVKYPRGSAARLWGIRACHGLGFLGVAAMRLAHGTFTERSLLIISSLVVSAIAVELASKYLDQ